MTKGTPMQVKLQQAIDQSAVYDSKLMEIEMDTKDRVMSTEEEDNVTSIIASIIGQLRKGQQYALAIKSLAKLSE